MKGFIFIVLVAMLFSSCQIVGMRRLYSDEGVGKIYIVKAGIGLEGIKKQFPNAKNISSTGLYYYIYVEDE